MEGEKMPVQNQKNEQKELEILEYSPLNSRAHTNF
jgi:hypothetical protein